MTKQLSQLLIKLAGWKGEILVEIPDKCVVCVAPHTSNWDFILGKLFYTSIGRTASFLIKESWFVFPFNLFFDWIGGVPVNRSKSGELTNQMALEFQKRPNFQLAITPEATRKLNLNWKKGFYYIALKAQVPILLVAFDYGRKVVSADKVFYPTGNEEADLKEIKSYYKNVTARHPQNFSVGEL